MNPSDLCHSLRESLPGLFACAVAPRAAVRVRTPFMYPDGDIVDVFVEERGAEYVVTDYGEALGVAADAVRQRQALTEPARDGG